MNNLYNQSDVQEILKRIKNLTPDAPRQWGTMGVAQMLAHCSKVLETAMGRNFLKKGFIEGFQRSTFLSEKPFRKYVPAPKIYLITDKRKFAREKEKAIKLVKAFYQNGPSKCTTHPHFLAGKLSPEEWAILEWKHLDHHLRQFGV